jgi:SPP1 gp7 family putative phage head morphogenesis protein
VLYEVIVNRDTLGIGDDLKKRVDASFGGATRAQRVARALDLIRSAVQSEVLGSPGYAGSWQNKFVAQAVTKGVTDAYRRMKAAGMSVTLELTVDVGIGQSAQRRADFIAQQSYDLLEGVDADMAAQMQDIIQQGLLDGKSPQQIARELDRELDIGRTRARTIARTETIAAHADATLDSFEEGGVEGVEAEVEFATAGDDNVCPQCQALEGNTYTIEEARGLIPVHPNCRCAWLPVIASTADALYVDYDPDEPRVPSGSAEGGQWTSGGSAVSKGLTAEELRAAGPADAKQKALDVAKELKFPARKVVFADEDKKFSVAGKRMSTAGEYDPETGLVTFYSKNISPGSAELIAAHEMTHSMYFDYFGSSGYQEPLIHLFGSYDTFAKEGGVDAYSNQWWKAVGEGKATPERAINETLASMASVQYTTGKVVGGPEHQALLRRIQRYRGVSGSKK